MGDYRYGYRKIGFGEKIGIVSLDFMNCVTNPGERMGKSLMAQGAVEKTAILLNAARTTAPETLPMAAAISKPDCSGHNLVFDRFRSSAENQGSVR